MLRAVYIRHSADSRSLSLLFLGSLYIFIQLHEKEHFSKKVGYNLATKSRTRLHPLTPRALRECGEHEAVEAVAGGKVLAALRSGAWQRRADAMLSGRGERGGCHRPTNAARKGAGRLRTGVATGDAADAADARAHAQRRH